MAQFFNAIATAVAAAKAAFDSMNPIVKEVLGYITALAGVLGTAALGVAAAVKAWGVFTSVVGPLVKTLPLIEGGFTGIAAAVGGLLAPLAAIIAAFLSVATAYGAIRNAMEGKFGDGVVDQLKQGFARALGDAKSMLADFSKEVEVNLEEFKGKDENSVLDFGTKGSKNTGSNAFGGLNASMKDGKDTTLDFGTQKDAFEAMGEGLREGMLDFSAAGGGLRDKSSGYEDLKDPLDAASTAFDKLNEKLDRYDVHLQLINDYADGMVDSFGKTTDANTDLQEAMAKYKDAQQQAALEAGGEWTNVFAGVTEDMLPAERDAARGNLSAGATTGATVVNGLAQAAGPAGAVASGVATAAMGNPAGLAQAGMALLTQSKSFQTIMMLINKTLSVLVQAINPILNAVIPALTVVLSIVGDVVKDIIKNLTPLMAPIMKLITTIMLIVKPFINIFMQLSTILVPILDKLIVPVLNALSAALMFVAKIVIDGVVNPLIEAWNAIIDAIDDVLGWLGVDLSSLKLHTVSLEDDADAVDSVTDSMNQLDQSSQNIPEGYKVALSAFNAYGGAPPPASAANPLASALQSALAPFKNSMTGAQAAAAVGNSMDFMTQYNKAQGTNVNMTNMYGNTAYNNAEKAYSEGDTSAATQTAQQVAAYLSSHSTSPTMSNKMALPTTSGAVSGATTNNASNSSVVVQNVSVQATSADLIGQMMSALKNQGYLKSGTNLMGATQRTQYGAA